jgi:hypothetical protein
MLEEAILVGDFEKFGIAKSSFVGNESEVRVSLLAIFTNNSAVIVLVGGQESFRLLVEVNADFGKSIVEFGFLASFSNSSF